MTNPKYIKILSYYLIALLFTSLQLSCKKDFLEKKPDKALLVPVTLDDFQELLNNSADVMNFSPVLPLISSDDLSITDNGYNALPPQEQKSYAWAQSIYDLNSNSIDWDRPYKQVFYANVVLDGLANKAPDQTSQEQYNRIKGQALFTRALAFYNISQEFAAPYHKASANTQPGIPIRLTADVNIKSVRGTLQQTYDQILIDLNTALTLLPASQNYLTRPNKIAAHALLARLYLSMGDYKNASINASICLQQKNTLINFNNIQSVSTYKMPKSLAGTNVEVIYHQVMNFSAATTVNATTLVDPSLYQLYDDNDLRKTLFFKKIDPVTINFKGNYTGTYENFSGLATDEIYLIQAECLARSGETQAAIDLLNQLLINRYATGKFSPLTANNAEEALNKILLERRKELLFRGLRWSDLRRLNQEPTHQTTLTRTIKGQTYTLLPNNNRYTLPIPESVIQATGMQQNPR